MNQALPQVITVANDRSCRDSAAGRVRAAGRKSQEYRKDALIAMVASSAGMPRAAIVGGGIGGVAAAAFLRRAGLPTVVYEQAPALSEVGAGLVLAPNAVRILRRLGVMDQLAGRAVPLEVGWEFRRWAAGQVLSAVRGAVTDPSPPRYSGIGAFRAIVPADRAPGFTRRRAQTLWIGPGHHLVHYPVSGGAAVNLVAFAPAGDFMVESWSATATVAEFLAEFAGWDKRLQDLIREAGTPGRWALLDRDPLGRWSRGPVTLLGDAAHPMFPFAQGAAQAIEDAAVLACCLAQDPQAPARALRRYESLRIGRTTRLQQVSHARAHVNHLPDGPEQQARDRSLAAADPLAASAWIYAYDPEEADADAAV